MPGKKSNQLSHATAMKAAKMRAEGYTVRQSSEATGIPKEIVLTRIALGERLLSVAPTKSQEQRHE